MTAIAHHPHRVARAVADARTSLASVAGDSVWSMDPAETTATLEQLTALEAQVAEAKARVLAHADRIEIGSDIGTRQTANWFAHHTKSTRRTAFRTMRLASGLDRHERTRAALAAGDLHAEQAEVIVSAVDQLPEGLDPTQIERAEQHLLSEAAHRDAKALRILGRHLVAVIDPDAADAHEAKLLEAEERAAQARTQIRVWDNAHGGLSGTFDLDKVAGATLKKILHAFASPKHRASHGPLGERRPSPQELGQAFAEMISRYPLNKLPKTGGLNTTIVVTMTLEALLGRLEAAQLDTGEKISASLARRLACESDIIPAVLGGKSQVLDLGRARRFFTQPQRLANGVQTNWRCEIEGCDKPAGHAHHATRWVDGGSTNLDDLIGLCPGHHRTAHDQRYDRKRLPTGKYTFNRRT
jgi:hypothetical protein